MESAKIQLQKEMVLENSDSINTSASDVSLIVPATMRHENKLAWCFYYK